MKFFVRSRVLAMHYKLHFNSHSH